MNVLVTGGAGSVGRFVVDELRTRGHEVTVAGRREGLQITGARYVSLDCTDYAAVLEQMDKHDSVVHLAAIPQPDKAASQKIFDINCRGTYNVYQACADAGIKKLVISSSVNALGFFYGNKPLPIQYFPVDEEHPTLCSDPYSFSKKINEETGQYYWEKDGISSIAIRIPWVRPCPPGQDRLKVQRDEVDTFFRIRNLWIWIDARDSARAFADALEKPYEGFHVLHVNDNVNTAGIPSRELAARFYPEVTQWKQPVEGMEALISCRKAKELLGWEPIFNTQLD